MAEIFQNREQKFENALRFSCIAVALKHPIVGVQHRSVWLGLIGPVTRCDATHPRQNVLKTLRCIKIACDGLQWVFQHVGISAPDFGISLLFIVRFSNGLDHCDGHLIGFHLMYSLNFFLITIAVMHISGEYGNSPS